MSLNVNKGGGTEFELVPTGLYVARCYRVLDLGTQTITSSFGTKEQHKVMIGWELLDDDVKMSDGRPYSVHKTYTASLSEKANLRADLESWRNVKFSEEELENFNLNKVVGSYCQVQVVHSEDGKFANVQSIVSYKAPKDAAGNKVYPKPVNDNVVFDIDEPDMAVFEALSDNMKTKIMSAPEWEAAKQKAVSEPVQETDDSFLEDNMPDDFGTPEWANEGIDEIIEPSDEELQGTIDLPDEAPKKKVSK